MKLLVIELYKEGNNYVVEVRDFSKNFGAVVLDIIIKAVKTNQLMKSSI